MLGNGGTYQFIDVTTGEMVEISFLSCAIECHPAPGQHIRLERSFRGDSGLLLMLSILDKEAAMLGIRGVITKRDMTGPIYDDKCEDRFSTPSTAAISRPAHKRDEMDDHSLCCACVVAREICNRRNFGDEIVM